ncbi:MAG: glucosidase, partial [Planctomycetota bacterium]
MTAESERLSQDQQRVANWKRWGPYLSERQWGTVREDYSANGDSWNYLTHEMSRSKAYRWGEDGLLGITDRQNRLCFGLALWNGQDPILKERLFGLTGPQGNHGEDVKECYFYLDSTPTHSYLKALYKYPQQEFPYELLVQSNANRSKQELEFELIDSGIFDEQKYFDVVAEYAKADPNDILIKISITNRGQETAKLHCLPTFWCRNTWSFGRTGEEGYWPKPDMRAVDEGHVVVDHVSFGRFRFLVDRGPAGEPVELLFTDNETNRQKLYGEPNRSPYVKDAFHRYVIDGDSNAVNQNKKGTKAAANFKLSIEPGNTIQLRMRICHDDSFSKLERTDARILGTDFETEFENRIRETDEFYDRVLDTIPVGEPRRIARQGYAGLLWTKQFYFYCVK